MKTHQFKQLKQTLAAILANHTDLVQEHIFVILDRHCHQRFDRTLGNQIASKSKRNNGHVSIASFIAEYIQMLDTAMLELE